MICSPPFAGVSIPDFRMAVFTQFMWGSMAGAFPQPAGQDSPQALRQPPFPAAFPPLKPPVLSPHAGTGMVFADLALHKTRKTRSDVLGCGESGRGRAAALDP